jgi:hypothetical protein
MHCSRLLRAASTLLVGTAGLAASSAAVSAEVISGPAAKGAQVYCFMRNSGNDHEVSWLAAYALIKRQSASLFKTSPEHGAVMITEAVVQNPGTFPDCGKYLGDLYANSVPTPANSESTKRSEERSNTYGGASRSERYAY